MNRIPFYKMNGSGNDFILIDNRKDVLPLTDVQDFASRICRRKVSVGADGLILVESSDVADFKWRFFNSDGSIAEMCGNGARCIARFSHLMGICGPDMTFETAAGIIHARVNGNSVKVTLPAPAHLKLDYEIPYSRGMLRVCSVNTGVPHLVVDGFDLESLDIVSLGRELRFHPMYAPAGTNVNFISMAPDSPIRIRTYERGVEDETLSCGTGSVAAAIIGVCRFGMTSPVKVLTQSGEILTVDVDRVGENALRVCLEGGTCLVYEGVLLEEAWQQR